MKKWVWFILSALIVLLDQSTKIWAINHLTPYESWPIFSGFSFLLTFNSGAAFSFLSASAWSRYFFTVFGIGMSILLTTWLLRFAENAYLQRVALSLILGGALGNLYDRLSLGYVIDFIHVYYKTFHWPVFNIADSAICLGAFLLILDLFINRKNIT